MKYKRLKLKIRMFFAGHSVAMVTYCVTKINNTNVFTNHWAVLIKSDYNDTSKVLECAGNLFEPP